MAISGGVDLTEVSVCKLKYGLIRSPAPNSCCIPSVLLRVAPAPLENRVKEGCSCSYDFGNFAGLYEKKEKNSK